MYETDQGISPEERMWKAVIIMFLQDLQMDMLKYKASLNGSRGFYWNRVQYYLNVCESPHIEFICHLASIDYGKLKKIMNDIVYNGKVIKIPRSFKATTN